MTFRDLFTGHWTWLQLLRDLAPLLIVAISAYFVGYARGYNAELSHKLKTLQRELGPERWDNG